MKLSFALLLLTTLLFNDRAYASLCYPGPDFDSAYKDATVVFTGEVLNEPVSPKQTAIFKVQDVYKGKPADKVQIVPGGLTGPGHELSKGKRYLVYASFDSNSFDVTGKNPDHLVVDGCKGGAWFIERSEKNLGMLKKRKNYLSALEEVGKKSEPRQKMAFLQMKAEHFLYWQDYANARETLEKILKQEPDNFWAFKELLHVLYEEKDPKAIWEIYLEKKDEFKEMYNLKYVSFAAFSLGKDISGINSNILEDVLFNGLERPNSTANIRFAKNVRFNGANLSGSVLGGTWTDVYISRGDFSNSKMTGIDLRSVSFSDTNLKNANFSHARIRDLILGYSDVENANFREATFVISELGRQNLKNADFTKAKILKSNLRGADFSAAILDGVSLAGSEYDCETKWPDGFDPDKAGAFNENPCPSESP